MYEFSRIGIKKLGHRIGGGIVSIDPFKTEVVKTQITPTYVRKL